MKINYFVAKNITSKKISYGFFSKIGGFSKNNFSSLNCNVTSGDNKYIVNKNIKVAQKALGLENKKIKFLKQTHSTEVKIINKKNLNKTINADGSITKDCNIVLAIITADCAPIFIFDLKNNFICSLHAGWKGCLNNIIKNAVIKINKQNISSRTLCAIVGPCLNKKNFEVDEEFKIFLLIKTQSIKIFLKKNLVKKKQHFDMRGLINFQLKSCLIDNISNISLDTYSNNDIFFSHRYSSHINSMPTGRMINLIGFKDSS